MNTERTEKREFNTENTEGHGEDTEEIWQSGPDDTQSLRNLIFLLLSVALRGPPW